MQRRTFIAGSAIACLLGLNFNPAALAGDIQTGATVDVKPNSIWFEDAAKLAQWQALKKTGIAAELASYQDKALASRDAWQFTAPLTVKVLGYDPAANQVIVEMTTAGRLAGTKWALDAEALAN